ncbi:MAG: hypothetical protein E5X67_10115 [Mesorhizobium sp.]|uniref:hypothetical protein n=1 Tax=Mesorhizobium sp. TaxID=1871066 RepID=UPI0011F939D1|nr:hypothetical protein [Mesorhizobium sp.]TIP28766.1 MAG: hypothetical protein E5X67_10115 [Mesorhizobium sp.]
MASAKDAIAGAEARLKTAYFGLEDMEQPKRYRSGLMNAVVFGRMVTLSLQNMRNDVEGFDAWYQPHQAAMEGDPMMTFFVKLRNTIEKQVRHPGTLRVKLVAETCAMLFLRKRHPMPSHLGSATRGMAARMGGCLNSQMVRKTFTL